MRISINAVIVVLVVTTVAYFELNDSTDKNNGTSLESLFSSSKQRVKDYNEARRIFWKTLYPKNVKSLYCGEAFNSNQRKGFNIEHVFPMSWVTNGLQCGTRKQCRKTSAIFNKIEADFHNLYPSRSDVNEKRSSFRFGLIKAEKRYFGNACDFEFDSRARVVEPAPNVRGDIARAMFYMANEYQQHGLVIFNKQAKLLSDWHQSDPPSDAEKSRNNVIEQIQGNRNPFIDNPESLTKLIRKGYFRN